MPPQTEERQHCEHKDKIFCDANKSYQAPERASQNVDGGQERGEEHCVTFQMGSNV